MSSYRKCCTTGFDCGTLSGWSVPWQGWIQIPIARQWVSTVRCATRREPMCLERSPRGCSKNGANYSQWQFSMRMYLGKWWKMINWILGYPILGPWARAANFAGHPNQRASQPGCHFFWGRYGLQLVRRWCGHCSKCEKRLKPSAGWRLWAAWLVRSQDACLQLLQDLTVNPWALWRIQATHSTCAWKLSGFVWKMGYP